MADFSRRALFGLAAGAAAVPVVALFAKEPSRMIVGMDFGRDGVALVGKPVNLNEAVTLRAIKRKMLSFENVTIRRVAPFFYDDHDVIRVD